MEISSSQFAIVSVFKVCSVLLVCCIIMIMSVELSHMILQYSHQVIQHLAIIAHGLVAGEN